MIADLEVLDAVIAAAMKQEVEDGLF